MLLKFIIVTCVARPRGPLRWLDPGAFGTLGVGGGFALGAKLCRPDSEVWIVYGDGSLGYSLAEFDTYTRHSVRYYTLLMSIRLYALNCKFVFLNISKGKLFSFRYYVNKPVCLINMGWFHRTYLKLYSDLVLCIFA